MLVVLAVIIVNGSRGSSSSPLDCCRHPILQCHGDCAVKLHLTWHPYLVSHPNTLGPSSQPMARGDLLEHAHQRSSIAPLARLLAETEGRQVANMFHLRCGCLLRAPPNPPNRTRRAKMPCMRRSAPASLKSHRRRAVYVTGQGW